MSLQIVIQVKWVLFIKKFFASMSIYYFLRCLKKLFSLHFTFFTVEEFEQFRFTISFALILSSKNCNINTKCFQSLEIHLFQNICCHCCFVMDLDQAWETSGPPSTLMWPSSYIWSFLNSYWLWTQLNIKEVPVLLQKQP